MRIAYASDCYLPEVNGISFCVENLAREMRRDNQVLLMVPDYGGAEIPETDLSVNIKRFKSDRIPLDKQTQLVWPNFNKLNNFFDEYGPQVVHIHTLGALGLLAMKTAKDRGIPTVATYHTLIPGTLASFPGFNLLPGLTKNIMWEYSRWVCDKADVIIAPSEAIKDALVEHGVKGEIIVINNGIETAIFKPGEKSQQQQIIYVGRISFEKGVDVLNDAMKLLPDVTLVMVGSGQAKLMPIKNVKMLGNVERNQLPVQYNQAKIFVTAAQFEVNPLVVLEAMACGLPVIGANKGGMAKGAVKNGINGYLLDDVTPEAFAQKIKELLSDEELLDKMGREARKTAEEHDVKVMVKKTFKVYQELIGIKN